MKAIDELRRLPNFGTVLIDGEETGLAETMVCVTRAQLNAISDAIENELKECYIERPTDKNGAPIHVDDVLHGERCGGGWCDPFKVTSMKVDEDGWKVYEFGDHSYLPNLCSHKPPTVEDVLREFAKSIAEVLGGDEFLLRDDDEMYAEFAERLRLKERDDD